MSIISVASLFDLWIKPKYYHDIGHIFKSYLKKFLIYTHHLHKWFYACKTHNIHKMGIASTQSIIRYYFIHKNQEKYVIDYILLIGP